jgi:ankyrin repeat protein
MIQNVVSASSGLPPIHDRQIRLLRLLPEDTDFQIRCEITVVHLDSEPKPKYTALSYAWGSPVSGHRIFLNGNPTEVGKNLWRFFRQVQRLPSPVFDFIWTDALCINQEDASELTQQIALMGEIYHSAEKVIAWLGPSYDSSDQATQNISLGASYWTTSRQATKKWTSPMASAIRSICTRRYWERLWIFQELLLARETLIMCGAEQIAMQTFIDFLLPIVNWYDQRTSTHAKEQFELKTVRQSPAVALIQLTSNWRDDRSIYELMILTRGLRCSKIRDRVYGLLGAAGRAQDIITVNEEMPLDNLIHRVLREHHNHHPPEKFKDIIEQCDMLCEILGVEPGKIFKVSQEALVWDPSMPAVEFEPLAEPVSRKAYAEADSSVVKERDRREPVELIATERQNTKARDDLYARGVPGNPLTFAWAAYHKHDAVMNFMLTNRTLTLRTAFIKAVKMDHYVAVAALLRAKGGLLRRCIDKPISYGANALQFVLHERRCDIAKLLVSAGANVNDRGVDHPEEPISHPIDSYTSAYPLLIAAVKGTTEIVKLLLDRGARINHRSSIYRTDSMTAIEAALLHGRADTAKSLRHTAMCHIDLVKWESLLAMAINTMEVSGVNAILELAFDHCARRDLELYSPKTTMVQRAVELGSPKILAALLQHGLSPDTNKGKRGSALQIAVEYEHIDIATSMVEVLLDYGADTEAAIKGSLDHPIHLAVRRRSVAMTELLLEHGADVNVRSKTDYQQTALHAAVLKDSISLAQLLVAGGADTEAVCVYQTSRQFFVGEGPVTPLCIAVGYMRVEMMKFLLQSGAKAEPSLLPRLSLAAGYFPNIQQTTIDEALKLLLDHGANAGREVSMDEFSREALGAPETAKYYERYPNAIRPKS